jgi:hypothetical protein
VARVVGSGCEHCHCSCRINGPLLWTLAPLWLYHRFSESTLAPIPLREVQNTFSLVRHLRLPPKGSAAKCETDRDTRSSLGSRCLQLPPRVISDVYLRARNRQRIFRSGVQVRESATCSSRPTPTPQFANHLWESRSSCPIYSGSLRMARRIFGNTPSKHLHKQGVATVPARPLGLSRVSATKRRERAA